MNTNTTARRLLLAALGTLLGATLMLPAPLSADSGPAHQALQSRPIQLGTSGGHINDRKPAFCCGGTLGALVTKGGVAYILSNNHVLARSNLAAVGDDILQPSLIDQSPSCAQDAGDVVADLSAWVPITFTKGTLNAVDAAIAQVRPGMVSPGGSILDIGTISSTPAGAAITMGVMKSGRTTGLTTGIVAAVSVTIDVRYGSQCGGGRGTARFTNQIRITPGSFSAGGDSGSLIVENVPSNPRPVGLLFAGGSNDTFANPIQSALAAFGVTMVGTSTTGETTFWQRLGSLLPSVWTADAEQPGRRPIDPGSQAAATQAKARHELAIMRIEGVVGLGVGASDAAPGQAVVEVYVKQATPAVRGAIPPRLDNVPVKVVETGEIIARTEVCPQDQPHPR